MGNHHAKQPQSLHDVESQIDICFVDLMTNVTKFSIDCMSIIGWESSQKNLSTCKKLVLETHNLFKVGGCMDTVTSNYIPTIITFINAINLTHSSEGYREISIKLLRMLTDLINSYAHMKSAADDRLNRLETENKQLREQVAQLNRQIMAEAVATPPQYVERPSAPPIEKDNCTFGTVIEL